jgi:hypothetical protein
LASPASGEARASDRVFNPTPAVFAPAQPRKQVSTCPHYAGPYVSLTAPSAGVPSAAESTCGATSPCVLIAFVTSAATSFAHPTCCASSGALRAPSRFGGVRQSGPGFVASSDEASPLQRSKQSEIALCL